MHQPHEEWDCSAGVLPLCRVQLVPNVVTPPQSLSLEENRMAQETNEACLQAQELLDTGVIMEETLVSSWVRKFFGKLHRVQNGLWCAREVPGGRMKRTV